MDTLKDGPAITDGSVPVLLLRPEEVATALRTCRTKVYALMGSGRLRSVKVGGSRRVSIDALKEFVRQLEAGEAA